MTPETRKALDRKREDLAWADADLAIRPEAPGTAKMAHVFAFKAGFDAACKLFGGMPEALREVVITTRTSSHHHNVAKQALADFKARIDAGEEGGEE